MAVNTIDIEADRPLAEEIHRLQRLESESGMKNGSIEASASGKDSSEGLALAPLVDKIAYGIARGLVVAMKELEAHIASETRKVGDTVGRRLDTLQASVHDLGVALSEQSAFSVTIQEQCRELASGVVSLKEADARQDVELEAVRTGAKETAEAITARIDAATTTLTEADRRQDIELGAVRSAAKETAEAITARIDAAATTLTEADRRQDVELEAVRTAAKETAEATDARIEAAAATLAEADRRQDAELEAVRIASKETAEATAARIDQLCKDLSVQQEDISAVKATLCGFSSTVEGLVERLDRQADALRTMCAAYAQRETELGSLVDGLARLRAYPAPAPTDRL